MLKNLDVSNLKASQAVYGFSNEEGSLVFTYESDMPALNYDRESPYSKAAFANVHKGTADEATVSALMECYNKSGVEDIQSSLATIGLGTNLILRHPGTNEIRVAMVFRTSTGPDGTPNLGAVSRAAGGADGDLAEAGATEFFDEIFAVAQTDQGPKHVMFNIVDPSLNDTRAAYLQGRQVERRRKLFEANGLEPHMVASTSVEGRVISVPGLTQDVVQVINGQESTLRDRFVTDPKGGDWNLDTVVCADLPEGVSFDDLQIFDGEEDLQGNLLQRAWQLKTPEEWIALMESGNPMSQAPKKFYENWNLVQDAVDRHFEP